MLESAHGSLDKALYLWSDMPRFEVSSAPLSDRQGQGVKLPDSPWLDHALFLSDQQVGLSLCVATCLAATAPLLLLLHASLLLSDRCVCLAVNNMLTKSRWLTTQALRQAPGHCVFSCKLCIAACMQVS